MYRAVYTFNTERVYSHVNTTRVNIAQRQMYIVEYTSRYSVRGIRRKPTLSTKLHVSLKSVFHQTKGNQFKFIRVRARLIVCTYD